MVFVLLVRVGVVVVVERMRLNGRTSSFLSLSRSISFRRSGKTVVCMGPCGVEMCAIVLSHGGVRCLLLCLLCLLLVMVRFVWWLFGLCCLLCCLCCMCQGMYTAISRFFDQPNNTYNLFSFFTRP